MIYSICVTKNSTGSIMVCMLEYVFGVIKKKNTKKKIQ